LLPYALGLWEPFPGEETLVADGIIPPSADLQGRWWQAVTTALGDTFMLPAFATIEPVMGGRRGDHSPHLTQLIDAMQLLHRQFPGARW
jgi:ring-1,2-phenylacetyl-CoA epoxidase subunit PaaC